MLCTSAILYSIEVWRDSTFIKGPLITRNEDMTRDLVSERAASCGVHLALTRCWSKHLLHRRFGTSTGCNRSFTLSYTMPDKSNKVKTYTFVSIKDFCLIDWFSVFSEEAFQKMPPRRAYNHPIELDETFKPRVGKVYPLSPDEQKATDDFVKENLRNGKIRPSMSPQASSFFYVGKKDEGIRPCQDYRYVNEHTIKDAYPLPLISDLIDKVKDAKLFTKFDIRSGYNNIRIKEGDEWKAAFITPKGLFEPTVMFFGLSNSPATFQRFMNDSFKDMIAEGWLIVYMDDMLITSRSKEEDIERTR